jgi:mannose-6-phosphate isomerase-like protein (cupin superfamily)
MGGTTVGFLTQEAKGLKQCLVDTGIDPQRLRLHVSEIAPGTSAHAAHTHVGIEAFYVLEGHGTVEVEGESHSLGPNESIILDASKPHGLVNIGTVPMRYLVVIAGH